VHHLDVAIEIVSCCPLSDGGGWRGRIVDARIEDKNLGSCSEKVLELVSSVPDWTVWSEQVQRMALLVAEEGHLRGPEVPRRAR
jgi:hypothetical protein